MNDNDFVFFWTARTPYSQWHKRDMYIDGMKFNCCEQWMMYSKAVLFNDVETAQKNNGSL